MPLLLRARALLPCLAVLLAVACRTEGDSLAPPPGGAPFLAIITRFDARPGAFLGDRYTYRISAIRDGVQTDTVVTAAPTDTVLLSVEPADYRVEVDGLPPNCFPRNGPVDGVLIPADANTGIVRFFIICDAKLSIDLVTDGRVTDTSFIYRLDGPGLDTLGRSDGDERLVFAGAAPGNYTFELADVAPNCVVTSPFGDRVPITVPEVGGVTVQVRVTCSEVERRPRIEYAVSRSIDGIATLFVVATDPNRDIERVVWELTDCEGRPLPGSSRRTRQNLAVTAAVVRDTSIISGVFETALPDAELRRNCAQIYLFDFDGNSTEAFEMRIGAPTESAPVALSFNARIVDQTSLVTDLVVDDPQRDQASVFPTVLLRDGVLSQPDGRPDLGVFAPAGYLSAADIPILRIGAGSRIQPFDILQLDVYLFDRTGDVRRVRDAELRE